MHTIVSLEWGRLLAAGLLALAVAAPSHGQSQPQPAAKAWPVKPIKIIVPYTPGGGTDATARLLASKLSEALGQPVIVENRPGGKSIIAYQAALREPADGYTFLFNNSSHTIQAAYKHLPYDAAADFTPVSPIARSSVVLAVAPNVPARSVAELLAWVRQNPGKVSYGSFGVGTASHLYGELFNSAAKVEMAHVAYKGSAQALGDLMGGHVQVSFVDSAAALPLVQSSKIRALAITGSARWKAYPEVPTFGELGYADLSSPGWWGLIATRQVPAEIIQRMAAEIKKIVAQPDVVQKLHELGAETHNSTPADFNTWVRSDMARWKLIVQSKNIVLD